MLTVEGVTTDFVQIGPTAARGLIVMATVIPEGPTIFGPYRLRGSPTIRILNPTGNTVIINVVYFFEET